MDLHVTAWAALLLSVERLCYVWVWRSPRSFERAVRATGLFSHDAGVRGLESLFMGFKLLQGAVFFWWWRAHSGWAVWALPSPWWARVLGLSAVALGQVLNLGVFYRLGSTGVFYGSRFGQFVPWCDRFPFSWCDHPQYVGAVLSIWGLFAVLRFPAVDWCVVPLLETVYYFCGAWVEHGRPIASRQSLLNDE